MNFPKSQAGMIVVDYKALDLLQKYLVSDYLDGYLNREEKWAYEHVIESGGFNPPGLARSGLYSK